MLVEAIGVEIIDDSTRYVNASMQKCDGSECGETAYQQCGVRQLDNRSIEAGQRVRTLRLGAKLPSTSLSRNH
jgi:hypothetical protein